MFKLCTVLVIWISFVTSNDSENETVIRFITTSGPFTCPHEKEIIEVADGERVFIEMRHKHFINYALITRPSQPEENVGSHKILRAEFTVSPHNTGFWRIRLLTNENATPVPNDVSKRIEKIKNDTYYSTECLFYVQVSTGVKMMLYYYLLGGGALIIVIQTGVILCMCRAKKVQNIEKLVISNAPGANDRARYSTAPGLKSSVNSNKKPEDDTPLPPPIETLPQPSKNNTITSSMNQLSTTTEKTAVSEEPTTRHRPPMALPNGSEDINTTTQPGNPGNAGTEAPSAESNLHLRGPGKVKIPAFCTASPPASQERADNVKRKPSAVNQESISKELNNVLKRRQTVTSQKPSTSPRPDVLRKAPGFPTETSVTQKSPKTSIWVKRSKQSQTPSIPPQSHPVQSQSHSIQSQPHPIQPQSHPIQSQAHPIIPQSLPSSLQSHPNPPQSHQNSQQSYPMPQRHTIQPQPHPSQSHPIHAQPYPNNPATRTPKPAKPLPPEPEEEPEYAEYDESGDEWRYEALEPFNKYNYNLYSE